MHVRTGAIRSVGDAAGKRALHQGMAERMPDITQQLTLADFLCSSVCNATLRMTGCQQAVTAGLCQDVKDVGQ